MFLHTLDVIQRLMEIGAVTLHGLKELSLDNWYQSWFEQLAKWDMKRKVNLEVTNVKLRSWTIWLTQVYQQRGCKPVKKATTSTMEALMSTDETAVATLTTSIEEVPQTFDVYNIGTNQSFVQFNMQLGDLVTRVMVMEEK